MCSDMGGAGTSQVIGEQSMPIRGNGMCKGQETGERKWLLEQLEVQHGMEVIDWRLKRGRFQAADVSLGFLIQLSYLQIGYFTSSWRFELLLKIRRRGHTG